MFFFWHVFGQLEFILDALAVVFEVFSGLVDALEEVHHVAQTNIDFHLVHVLEDLSCFDLALNLQGNLWSVHTQLLLVQVHPLFSAVSVLC